jgi:hypothetical protein
LLLAVEYAKSYLLDNWSSHFFSRAISFSLLQLDFFLLSSESHANFYAKSWIFSFSLCYVINTAPIPPTMRISKNNIKSKRKFKFKRTPRRRSAFFCIFSYAKWNEGEASEDNKELELKQSTNKTFTFLSAVLPSETCKNSFCIQF